MRGRFLIFAAPALLIGVAAAPAGAEENQVQRADRQIEACLAEARAQAPDQTAHGRRMVLANECICAQNKDFCSGGMVQDPALRQRILDDK